MWLMGCPNPYKLQESWECTFLKVFTHTMTKWASIKLFNCRIQNGGLWKAQGCQIFIFIGFLLASRWKLNDNLVFYWFPSSIIESCISTECDCHYSAVVKWKCEVRTCSKPPRGLVDTEEMERSLIDWITTPHEGLTGSWVHRYDLWSVCVGVLCFDDGVSHY